MTRIVVFTVQCKSIEPANTNIRNATHTPGSARSNIAERTTPHNAKACRQMEASNNADSATLSMKNKTKQLRQLAHMHTRVLVLVLVQGNAKAKANFASDLPLDTVRDLVGAFRLAIPGTTKFIQISIFNWRKFDLIMKNEKFKFWLDFVRKMLQFRVRTARDTHEMPPNSLLAWPNLALPSPGLSGSVKGLPLYMFEQQLLL